MPKVIAVTQFSHDRFVVFLDDGAVHVGTLADVEVIEMEKLVSEAERRGLDLPFEVPDAEERVKRAPGARGRIEWLGRGAVPGTAAVAEGSGEAG